MKTLILTFGLIFSLNSIAAEGQNNLSYGDGGTIVATCQGGYRLVQYVSEAAFGSQNGLGIRHTANEYEIVPAGQDYGFTAHFQIHSEGANLEAFGENDQKYSLNDSWGAFSLSVTNEAGQKTYHSCQATQELN